MASKAIQAISEVILETCPVSHSALYFLFSLTGNLLVSALSSRMISVKRELYHCECKAFEEQLHDLRLRP